MDDRVTLQIKFNSIRLLNILNINVRKCNIVNICNIVKMYGTKRNQIARVTLFGFFFGRGIHEDRRVCVQMINVFQETKQDENVLLLYSCRPIILYLHSSAVSFSPDFARRRIFPRHLNVRIQPPRYRVHRKS